MIRPRPHQIVTHRALGPDDRVHSWAREFSTCAKFARSEARDKEPLATDVACYWCLL